MELHTVVDDFFVTASLALLLTFLVVKLVEAINDTHTAPKRHVRREPVPLGKRLKVQPAQSKSKVGFISPVQAATCVGTQHNIEEAKIEPVPTVQPAQSKNTVDFISPLQAATGVETERKIEEEATVEPVCSVPTVQLAQSKNTVSFISSVQAATCEETERNIEEEATVEAVHSFPTVQLAQSKNMVSFISPVRAATCVEKERKIEEATVEPVQTGQSKSTIDFISPVEASTGVRTECKIEEEAKVESDSNVVVESPVKSDLDIAVKEEIAESNEGTTQELDDSSKRNVESVEASTEIEDSVVESVMKENDHHDDDDDDWEGIERSELETEFMAATKFASDDNRLESVGSNVRMELYGLHKVATEGPCRDPHPMPLKLFARAKWNAWQKLGNMSPEVAMEQYISLLSDKFPGWMKDTSYGMSAHDEPTRPEVSDSAASDLSTTLSHQQMIITKRELEQESDSKDRSLLTESDLENNVKK